MQVTFPRIVLAEFNTHRMFSRNSASSRAIPVEKQIKRVMEDPFIPVYWGKNQKGMSADEELGPMHQQAAERAWLMQRDNAVRVAQLMLESGVHKQITNRLLEPFMWHTVIVTATEWENFFTLRCHKDAQPEIRVIAEMMRAAYATPRCRNLTYGEWHLPLVSEFDLSNSVNDPMYWVKVSAGRCARVSYLTHDGKRDPEADIALCDRLVASGHMSPMEHQAKPRFLLQVEFCGNFRGWTQFRKTIPGEEVFRGPNVV
jgi:thymidylate synthase ThyX